MSSSGASGACIHASIFPAGPSGEKYREIQVDASSGLIGGLGEPELENYSSGVAVIEPEALGGDSCERAGGVRSDRAQARHRTWKSGSVSHDGPMARRGLVRTLASEPSRHDRRS